MSIPLEDFYEDILGKAQRGLKVPEAQLLSESGITKDQWQEMLAGTCHEQASRSVAPVLRLGADRLIAAGKNSWHPGIEELPEGLLQFNTPFDDMTVNAYLVWDPASRKAMVFDSGAKAEPTLEAISAQQLTVEKIFLTHTHTDHIVDLPRLQKSTEATTHVHKEGDIGGVRTFEWGESFQVGALEIETRQTTGHAADGTTFVVRGLSKPVAIVGDALFAGSMGGGMISFPEALETNRKSIFTLEDECLLCPGHGPVTSVSLEKTNNPFYPEFQNS